MWEHCWNMYGQSKLSVFDAGITALHVHSHVLPLAFAREPGVGDFNVAVLGVAGV
jgi:hypothetical protein